MRTEGQTVYVLWYGKVLQGNVVRENDMMGMTAVRIPLQGQHPIALFTPGHVYDTADEAENSKSVPKVSETSQCEAFKKAHWDTGRNCLRTDSLDEFYSLWKMEHTPHGHIEATAREPVPAVGTKPCTKAVAKKHTETIQLSLFD